jgi:serine/threonine protein kinase
MIGQTLSHFKITAKLGEGGMGEVYRAEDTKLGREVALKVLPDEFAQDPERMERFAREAQMLASLNHPNIAGIYQVEQVDDVQFLVMELVEGDTLQERIARGPISVEETARIGLEMAQGIEVAHEKGIVHRDLKPANVKLTPEGQVKILDFGLAKALEGELDRGEFMDTQSPTVAATLAGIIIGTAPYMSPEQAAGQVADRRSDVWSYGVVLAEMLTGRRQFGGETVSHTLASVLKDEPNWEQFPKDVPLRVLDLLQRCLRKDAKQRIQAIGDARVLWEEYLADPEAFEATTEASTAHEPIPTWKKLLPWALATALAVALFVVANNQGGSTNQSQPVVRAVIPPPPDHHWLVNFQKPSFAVLSPDGLQVAFTAFAEEAIEPQLWVRPLDSPVGRSLPDTEGAALPFWSPDSSHLAFFANDKLKKIAISGGAPISLCDAPRGRGGTWNRDGIIVFSPSSREGLSRVSAAGGECVPVTQLDNEADDLSHRMPYFLPDNNQFLYLARRGTRRRNSNTVRIGSLDGSSDLDLVASTTSAIYASGRLLFSRDTTLVAQSFDPEQLEFRGEAIPLIESVLELPGTGAPFFSTSETGNLVHFSGYATRNSQLLWKDRGGTDIAKLGEPQVHGSVYLSADGMWASSEITGEDDQQDLWIYDIDRDLRSRFTFDPGNDVAGVWSPDGDRIVFSSDRDTSVFDLYLKDVGGTGEPDLLYASANAKYPFSWTPDGKTVLFHEVGGERGTDILALPTEGDRVPVPIIQSKFREAEPAVSPDGRWLAYSSNESGQIEVYVTTFPQAERKWQISISGGRQPTWTKNGAEIVFINASWDALVAAEVRPAGDTFEVGSIRDLFTVDLRPGAGRDWHVTPDGERFLLNMNPLFSAPVLHLVINWPAMLED